MLFGHQVLNLACIPFHHLAVRRTLTGIRKPASPSGSAANYFKHDQETFYHLLHQGFDHIKLQSANHVTLLAGHSNTSR